MITAPGAIKPRQTGQAHIFVLSTEEGGRHKPFHNGYKPQFYFGTTDVTGEVTIINDTGTANPGDQVDIEFQLLKAVGIESGMRFAIREGGKTIGAGIVA